MKITHDTKIVGLLGESLSHSLSAIMHNEAFARLGLRGIYLLFEISTDQVVDALKGVLGLNLTGLNVTFPHKELVAGHVDELSADARAVGAVNTVVNRDGRLLGANTDVAGFAAPLQAHSSELRGRDALVLGAGGAARAVVLSLLSGFHLRRVRVANRSRNRAERLAEGLRPFAGEGMAIEVVDFEGARDAVEDESTALVVNSTTVGTTPDAHPSPLPGDTRFREDQVVYDLVYNPLETRLLRAAAEQGARIIGGLEMLIAQGAASFEMWTGREMPTDHIREVLEFELSPKDEILIA